MAECKQEKILTKCKKGHVPIRSASPHEQDIQVSELLCLRQSLRVLQKKQQTWGKNMFGFLLDMLTPEMNGWCVEKYSWLHFYLWLLIHGWVMEAMGPGEKPRHVFPKWHFLACPGDPEAFPSQSGYIILPASLGFSPVSYQWELPRIPLKGEAL